MNLPPQTFVEKYGLPTGATLQVVPMVGVYWVVLPPKEIRNEMTLSLAAHMARPVAYWD